MPSTSTYGTAFNTHYSSSQTYYTATAYQNVSSTTFTAGPPWSSSRPRQALPYKFLYRKLGKRTTFIHRVWACSEEEAIRDAPTEMGDDYILVGILGR